MRSWRQSINLAYNITGKNAMSIETLRTILYSTSAIVGLFVIYSGVRQKSHLARYFFFAALCAFFYIFGYAFELGAHSLEELRFWIKFEYFGLSFIASFWFLLSWKLWFSRNPRFRMMVMVFIIPAITLFLVSTQEFQRLFYRSLRLSDIEGYHRAIIEKGPWYWVQIAYQFACIILSIVLQWLSWRRRGGVFKSSGFWMFVGTLSLLPWIIIYQLGKSNGIDLGPFGIALSLCFIAIAVLRYGTLSSEEVFLYSIFAGIDDGVVILDRDGKISNFNAAAQKIFPWLNSSSIGMPISDPADAPFFNFDAPSKMEKVVELAGNKRYFQGRFTLIYEGRSVLGRVYFFRDITDSRRLTNRLRKLANFDALTSLYNRRRFMERAEKVLANAQRTRKNIALLMIDVDHFKNVNDRFGHAVGDRVLAAVGRIIRRRCKNKGFAGRYGGEEFVVLLHSAQREQALDIAEGIRRSIEGIAIENRMIPVRVTVSIGVSSCAGKEGVYDLDELLMSADRALYLAKNRGRNRVEG